MITTKELDAGTWEIRIGKTFDFESHKDFRQAVKDVMSKNPHGVQLNFGEVEYLDSSALGMLMLAKHESDAKGASIVISNLDNGHARKVLELVKFDQIFQFV